MHYAAPLVGVLIIVLYISPIAGGLVVDALLGPVFQERTLLNFPTPYLFSVDQKVWTNL